MKKIPTISEAKRSYDAIIEAGGTADMLPPLTQIILNFSPVSIFARWSFRCKLRAILVAGMGTPKSETKADTFVKKFSGKGTWLQLATLLIKAIKEAEDNE